MRQLGTTGDSTASCPEPPRLASLLVATALFLAPTPCQALEPCPRMPALGPLPPRSAVVLSVPVDLRLLCLPATTDAPGVRKLATAPPLAPNAGPPEAPEFEPSSVRPLQQTAHFAVPDLYHALPVFCFGLPEGDLLAAGEWYQLTGTSIYLRTGAHQPFRPASFTAKEAFFPACSRHAAYVFEPEAAPSTQLYRWTVTERGSDRAIGPPHLGFTPYVMALAHEDGAEEAGLSVVKLGKSYDLLIEAIDTDGQAAPPVRVSVDMHPARGGTRSVFSGPQLGGGGFASVSHDGGDFGRSAGGYWLEAGWGWERFPGWLSLNGGLFEGLSFDAGDRERAAYLDVTLLLVSAGPLVVWRDGRIRSGGFVGLNLPLPWLWSTYGSAAGWTSELHGMFFLQLRADFPRELPNRLQLGAMYKVLLDP